jgi:hypothetical protein
MEKERSQLFLLFSPFQPGTLCRQHLGAAFTFAAWPGQPFLFLPPFHPGTFCRQHFGVAFTFAARLVRLLLLPPSQEQHTQNNQPTCIFFPVALINARPVLFPLAEIFFCRSAYLSGQTGGGQLSRQTVQLGQNFRGLPNKSYCS